ncbi:MAG: nitroreductase family protein [Alphaproteobacteria bacterium]|nr:nitroreductase family protein [Alphaproteobacteria bacterium]
MELMEGILTRRSVRQYQDKKIDKETIKKIIRAAQYSPTAHNRQPWEFLVIEDKKFMEELRHIQRWTSFAKDASCVIIVCGDTDKSFSRDKDDEKWSFIDVDCAIATQSLMLAAWAEGIGTCYCGAAPMQKVVDALSKKLNLSPNIRPFAIVPMGYPLDAPKQPDNRYDETKIHWIEEVNF